MVGVVPYLELSLERSSEIVAKVSQISNFLSFQPARGGIPLAWLSSLLLHPKEHGTIPKYATEMGS